MRARILNVKLGFLCRLLSSLFSHCSIATETFKTLAKVDVFNLSIVQQCLFLDADFGTNAVATVLNNGDDAMCVLKQLKNEILKKDREIILREASSHTSVGLAETVNWLRVWEEEREKGRYWTKIIQQFFKLITIPVFSHYNCPKCGDTVPKSSSFIEHISTKHSSSVSVTDLISQLASAQNITHSMYCSMRAIVVA